ncbi:hypothetical protein MLP_01120 [Microlunatus phosphovorus NM-1]|uniref:Glycosyltransferase RgtA/B/C/D-like domain-containing protein n=2 Tax=Microlunatus phosphovorus TaxID=29405 RepID=F5XGL9_MICPN|nr:hypothetical protein [Microlunatus phosphovorus]BAK33126.1 hypothetical protein MLP_01120 [Microlunatus phosphovorus NM-1]
MSTRAAADQASGSAERATQSSGRMVLQAWLASRGLIALVALLLAVYQGRSLADMIDQWDVEHFTNLALHGYLGRADGTLMAFFPGLPALFRLGLELGIPIYVSGVVISAICSYLAAVALARLGGPLAAVAWLFAPTAVFTIVPYTEALFCAAAFWAWERARRDRWATAALLAGVACTVRVSGLFLVGALAVMALTSAGPPDAVQRWRERGRRLLWLLLPTAVLAAFVGYLYSLTGSWTAWYTAQATGWARSMTLPWESFWNTVAATHPNPDHPLWPPVFVAEIVSMALGVLAIGWCLGRRLWAEASWVAVQVLAFSLSYWFMSVNRAILLWFPLWMMIGHLAGWRPGHPGARVIHRVVVGLAFAGSIVVMLVWSWLYFTGNWAS